MIEKKDKKDKEKTDQDNETENSSTLSPNEENEENSDYEVIDITDNPLYQVLSAFFETEDGENICEILKNLSNAVEENTKTMQKLLRSKKA